MDLARRRLEQQHLVGSACACPEDVVANLLAVQAQDYLGAKWAVAQRTLAGEDAAVQQAFQDGRILRTHVLRPTWHFVAPADLGWLLELTAPRVHALNAYYYRKHGLDARQVKRNAARIVRALSSGQHLTRDELARALGASTGAVSGNHLVYVLMHAEQGALICSGAMRGKLHTYALFEARAPRSGKLSRDEALARLAQRYVSGHGPAQAQDLAWWSGLTVADAQRGLEGSRDRLERSVMEGKTYWFTPAPGRSGRKRLSVHLLPNYDELVIAFKDRSAMLDPTIAAQREVLSAHFVVINGRIVGSWRRTLEQRQVVIAAQLLRPFSTAERRGLDAAALRYARSLGLALRFEAQWLA